MEEVKEYTDLNTIERNGSLEDLWGFQSLGVVKQLVREGAFSPVPEDYPKTPIPMDMEKLTRITNTYIPPEDTDESTDLQPNKEKDLLAKSQSYFRKVVKAFVDRGIVPSTLAIQVGKIVRPESLEADALDEHSFTPHSESIPEEVKQRKGKIKIGLLTIKFHEKVLKAVLANTGMSLSDQQVEEVAIRMGISHEYGHAVERTVNILNTQRKIPDQKSKQFYQTLKKMEQALYNELLQQGDRDVLNLPILQSGSEEPIPREDIYREAIAAGFERLGLEAALYDVGLSEEQVRSVIATLQDTDSKIAQEYQEIDQLAKEKGFSGASEVGYILDTLPRIYTSLVLSRPGEVPLSRKLPYFSLSRIGYRIPINEAQIKRLVSFAA